MRAAERLKALEEARKAEDAKKAEQLQAIEERIQATQEAEMKQFNGSGHPGIPQDGEPL